MNLKNLLIKAITIVVMVFTFLSCDNDFNTVGSEVIGDVNFTDDVYTYAPTAYSKKFDKVQTSGLPNNVLGVYNDPVYGQSVYSVLSQVQLDRNNPVFGDNAVLDRVVLSLPYYSREISETTNAAGVTTKTYALDSVYGNDPVRLSIYKSDYFLSDFDTEADPKNRKRYYSDFVTNLALDGKIGTDPPLIEEDFVPSNIEVKDTVPDGDDPDSDRDEVRLAPQLRVELPPEHFQTHILDKEGSVELSNPNNFRNYYRGFYFKTTALTADGSLVFFDMKQAKITLYYTYDKDGAKANGDIKLSFTNTIINGIETTLNPEIATELLPENQDQVNGEENLYLKGGVGSYAVIDLFGPDNDNNGVADELEELRAKEWLINGANIKFYINKDKMIGSGETEPERIHIFDVETGQVLIDYAIEISNEDPKTPAINAISHHLGRISRGSDKKGEFYLIRLTQHIIDVINKDKDNLKLGLSVSQNVKEPRIVKAIRIEGPTELEEIIPVSSMLSHEGTVLYGTGSSVPESKRLQLEIFYTAPK